MSNRFSIPHWQVACAIHLLLLPLVASTGAERAKPKLVVLLTVDGLRGDMPWRFKDRFERNGIRRLAILHSPSNGST